MISVIFPGCCKLHRIIECDASDQIDEISKSGEINAAIVVDFNIIEFVQRFDRIGDTLDRAVRQFVITAQSMVHDVEITRCADKKNLLCNGIDSHQNIYVCMGIGSNLFAIFVHTAEIKYERTVFTVLDRLRSGFGRRSWRGSGSCSVGILLN